MPRRVQCSIQPGPMHTTVIFLDRAKQVRIGAICRFRTDELVMEMLRRAKANLETCAWVEAAMIEHRPVMIDLVLSEEQFARLTAPRR